MNSIGLSMASRYSYPPNSLSLCGPQRQADLRWYAGHQTPDGGTKEILEQFATLYPYLRLIAGENRLKDPFDPRVVEAYWLGNPLLTRIPVKTFVSHLSEGLGLKRKLPKKKLEQLFDHAGAGALPNHAFHVAAIYKRTGHADIPHTLATMDACIINWGTVVEKSTSKLITETRPLVLEGNRLAFGPPLRRRLVPQGPEDVVFNAVAPGDTVSYHWGYLCEKLSKRKLANLILYTNHVEIVVPTGQNQIGIERSIGEYLEENLDKPREEITGEVEKIVRAYDPCMSCASHFLKVRWSKSRQRRLR